MIKIREWQVLAVVCLIGFNGFALAADGSSMTAEERAKAAAASRRRALQAAKNHAATKARENAPIMVQAHLIGVSIEGLQKSGVKPFGIGHKPVSMDNILWCLGQENMAKVISKMKVSSLNGVPSEVTSTNAVYDASTKRYMNPVKTFSAEPDIKSADCINIQIRYLYEAAFGLNKSEFRWQGSINVKPGVPQIAAEMQGFDFIGEGDLEKTITFLVITATIQDPAKQKTQNTTCTKVRKVTDLNRMQGTWKGTEIRNGRGGEWTMVIKGNRIEADGPGPEDYSGTIVIDETESPKSARYNINECAFKKYVGTTANNIYKFDGEKLVIAGTEPGSGTKPTTFEPGNGARVFEFKKVKSK